MEELRDKKHLGHSENKQQNAEVSPSLSEITLNSLELKGRDWQN